MKKPNWLQNFFIICSGADRETMYQCPTEYNKYSGIGATIFLTASLAVFTGGYAMNFVFDNLFLSVIFGILWGIIIFNLDRYIVLSLRKERIPTRTEILRAPTQQEKNELLSDRKRMLWNQGLMAAPRFLIALVIAVTISKPLELRLFSTKILKEHARVSKVKTDKFDEDERSRTDTVNKELQNLNQQEEKDKTAIYKNNPIYNEAVNKLPALQTAINNKDSLITVNDIIIDRNRYLETGYRKKYNLATKEWETEEYKYWKKNETALAKDIENASLNNEKQELQNEKTNYLGKKDTVEKQLAQQVAAIMKQYAVQQSRITQSIENLKQTYQSRKDEYVKTVQLNPDILERLEYLGNISSLFNPVWWASFIITLLFMLLEIAPVLVKLLTKRGSYDERIDLIEYEHYINTQEIISRWNTKINELLERAKEAAKLEGDIFIKVEKQRLELELKSNQAILDDLALKQEKLAKMYIDKWYKDELSKTSGNLNKIENKLWKAINLSEEVFYLFKNGTPSPCELIYIEKGEPKIGKWEYINNRTMLKIDLDNLSKTYQITTVTDKSLRLNITGTNDYLELIT